MEAMPKFSHKPELVPSTPKIPEAANDNELGSLVRVPEAANDNEADEAHLQKVRANLNLPTTQENIPAISEVQQEIPVLSAEHAQIGESEVISAGERKTTATPAAGGAGKRTEDSTNSNKKKDGGSSSGGSKGGSGSGKSANGLVFSPLVLAYALFGGAVAYSLVGINKAVEKITDKVLKMKVKTISFIKGGGGGH
jgi:hypothetical protein